MTRQTWASAPQAGMEKPGLGLEKASSRAGGRDAHTSSSDSAKLVKLKAWSASTHSEGHNPRNQTPSCICTNSLAEATECLGLEVSGRT